MKNKALAAIVLSVVLLFSVLIYTQYSAKDRFIGATAECRDGSYSASKKRAGTCSGHGGVKEWIYD